MAVDYGTLKKGGFMRQKQKNNFSLRIAVVGGTLTAENLKKIAEVAEKHGEGYVHLTSRQGVEIPFIKLEDIDVVKEELAEGGCKPGVSDREFVPLLPVREMRFVRAVTLTHRILQRSLTSVTSAVSFHINLNLALRAAVTTV